MQEWYTKQCDGEWEHHYGVEIDTLDNPGWHVVIDVESTELSDVNFDGYTMENGNDDWYFIEMKNRQFRATGDPSKLEFLLSNFKEIVEQHKNK